MNVSALTSLSGGFYSNKNTLKVLKYASDNPALVEKGATLILSTLIRPVSILMTPKTDKREKQYMFAKSFASGALSYGLTSFIFKPVSRAMDMISNEPQKYLTNKTINTLKTAGRTLEDSKPFNYLKQTVKYTPAIVSILPKALLTTALITPIIEIAFDKKFKIKKPEFNLSKLKSDKLLFHKEDKKESFKGERLARAIAKSLNNESVQKFALRHQNSDLFIKIISMKDMLATGVFALLTKNSKRIEEKNKKPLIINSLLSTGLAVAGGFAVDKATKKPMENFLFKLEQANRGDKNLPKYIEGAKILKPIVILGVLYYSIVPFVSTFLSGKIAHFKEDKNG